MLLLTELLIELLTSLRLLLSLLSLLALLAWLLPLIACATLLLLLGHSTSISLLLLLLVRHSTSGIELLLSLIGIGLLLLLTWLLLTWLLLTWLLLLTELLLLLLILRTLLLLLELAVLLRLLLTLLALLLTHLLALLLSHGSSLALLANVIFVTLFGLLLTCGFSHLAVGSTIRLYSFDAITDTGSCLASSAVDFVERAELILVEVGLDILHARNTPFLELFRLFLDVCGCSLDVGRDICLAD